MFFTDVMSCSTKRIVILAANLTDQPVEAFLLRVGSGGPRFIEQQQAGSVASARAISNSRCWPKDNSARSSPVPPAHANQLLQCVLADLALSRRDAALERSTEQAVWFDVASHHHVLSTVILPKTCTL